ncbi:MAG TPA: 4Fe-4S binding protein [Anaeromyxobacteraceae bacterium]
MSDALVSIGRRAAPQTRLQRWRRASQLAAVALIGQWSFYGVFRCPFVVPYVSCRSCPVLTCHGRILTTFWGFWLALPFAAVLFGRAFCGWACPGGLASQLLAKIAPLRPRASALGSRVAAGGAVVGLAWAGFAFYTEGQKRVAVPIRIGGFFQSVALTFEHASPAWLARTWVVLAVLATGIVVANAWCRFACPLGGALELIRRFSLFGFRSTASCNHCEACRGACEHGTLPDESGCTSCGDCRGACPSDAIRFGARWRP